VVDHPFARREMPVRIRIARRCREREREYRERDVERHLATGNEGARRELGDRVDVDRGVEAGPGREPMDEEQYQGKGDEAASEGPSRMAGDLGRRGQPGHRRRPIPRRGAPDQLQYRPW